MLTETQLAGINKDIVPIREDDYRRILTALGLRKVPNPDPAGTLLAMPIVDQWQARAKIDENKRVPGVVYYRIDFSVHDTENDRRVGSVYRVVDMRVLQARGAQIMNALFTSVDELAPFTCGECGAVALTWDGRVPEGSRKAGQRCGACGWTGRSNDFKPFVAFK